MNDTRIAVCVATFRRTRLLARLLASLDELAVPRGVSVELRVVDNDAAGSAHSLVAFFRAQQRTFDTVHYGIEAEPNIANARNATLDFVLRLYSSPVLHEFFRRLIHARCCARASTIGSQPSPRCWNGE